MTAYRSFQRTAPEGASRLRTSTSTQEEQPPTHPLLKLQSQVGNSAVARMLSQRQEAGEMEEEEAPAMALHDPASVQRQEAEGGEMEEEEAPAMALHDRTLRRLGTEEEEPIQGKHDTAAPQVGLEGGPVGEDIESRIDSARGSGSGLDSSFRSKMEASTGESLEGVRVHTGSESDALNRSISAKAFTTGNDIFLRSDVNTSDHQTMAHEVAHVVQQRTMDTGATDRMSVGAADSSYEHEADQFASAALAGASTAGPEREEA
jgi:hypothetical protein